MEPKPFLPISRKEMEKRGWSEVDFVYVCGDAYVDHPSFGHAIITRLLEREGYRVGVIAQPDISDPASIEVFGSPRLGFLISAGNMDSMVNHYTVAKRPRRTDLYSPGGKRDLRPDRAVVVYTKLVRQAYPDAAIVIGGIEASLRRLAHYDYWSDSVKRSILLDAGADLVSYGMGERSIVDIADALNAGLQIDDLTFIPGTVYRTSTLEHICDPVMLPAYDEIAQADDAGKHAFATSFAVQYRNTDPITGSPLVEAYAPDLFVVQNPPAMPLDSSELDAIYRLPFQRKAHPVYDALGGVPAFKEVAFSLTSSRGCFGDCSFCALTFHQGRIVTARSIPSLIEEARELTGQEGFKGYIHDVGGPTANFRHAACAEQLERGVCARKRCLSPKPCANLVVSHEDYRTLLDQVRALPGVKKVFIRSGIRFDYVMLDKDSTFFETLVENHVSGQLKVAPEHVSKRVLDLMGKPPIEVYDAFAKRFAALNKKLGKKQYLVPYLMSSHPGSDLNAAIELAEYVRDMGYNPEQVQDFYPTPGSRSTAMYYTGYDPLTMEKVYVARDPHEKAMQRALIQYRNPKNRKLVIEALKRAKRTDLIGHGKNCLVRPHAHHKKIPAHTR